MERLCVSPSVEEGKNVKRHKKCLIKIIKTVLKIELTKKTGL